MNKLKTKEDYKIMKKYKVSRSIHSGYNEEQNIFGKYQYTWEERDKNGETIKKISLIFLNEYYHCWEIYCLKGKLFNDVERFDTKVEAEEQIKKYLR